MILSDRRKDIFTNISLCEENCVYKGINFTLKQIKCDCSADSVQDELKDFMKNEFTSDIFHNNIAIVKCYASFSKITGINISFIFMIIFLLIMITFSFFFIYKDLILLLTVINKYLPSSPTSIQQYQYSTTDSPFIQIKTLTPPVVGMPKEADNFPYQRAVNLDNRNFINMAWNMYLQKENITKICFPSPFESTSVNINNYIFAICLDFTINALFYTDDQLSSRYKNRGLSFGQDLLRSLPSNIIGEIVSSVFASFVSYPPILEMMSVEIKSKKLVVFMEKYFHTIKMKIIMFHLLLFIFLLFSFYYLTLFCIIYHASQVSWFTGCIYSVFTSIIVNICMTIGLTALRWYAINYRKEYAFNVIFFIKRLIQ